MKKKIIYDLVKELLADYPKTRDSDRLLHAVVCKRTGFVERNLQGRYFIYIDDLLKNTPSFESVRRSRQKIQELHPELRGSEKIRKARTEKAEEKGTWIFREVITEQKALI